MSGKCCADNTASGYSLGKSCFRLTRRDLDRVGLAASSFTYSTVLSPSNALPCPAVYRAHTYALLDLEHARHHLSVPLARSLGLTTGNQSGLKRLALGVQICDGGIGDLGPCDACTNQGFRN